MLKQLRIQFILTNTLYVGVVLILVFVLICAISYNRHMESLDQALLHAVAIAADEERHEIRFGGGENFDAIDLLPYILIISENPPSEDVRILRRGADMEQEKLLSLFEKILASDEDSGSLSGNLYYARNVQADRCTVAITNKSYIRAAITELVKLLSLIGACALALVIAVSFPVAKVALLSTEKAWEQQKRFIADASHALKTPLTVILANISILKNSPMGKDEEARHWLTSTEEEAKDMHTLVQDMLVLEQSDLNVRRTDFTNVNLSQLLEGLALQFEAVAFDKNIRLEVVVPENAELRGSEKGLSQMVSALLDNAFKYEKSGGLVRLKLEKQVRKTILSVYNQSTYIRPEERERIFDRFLRLKNPETRAHEGHGLGLSIARSVADAHQAAIEVESSVSSGTEFRVIFRHIL